MPFDARTRPLTAPQARVLATLLEKSRTVPDSYPLTLNSLLAGCNQKSSRDPVMQLTESEVQQALDEYINAWFVCKLLSREYGLGDADGFVFNMSVGYDYEGITSPKIDAFIEGLKDASDTPAFKACKEWALANLRLFENVNARFGRDFFGQVQREAKRIL